MKSCNCHLPYSNPEACKYCPNGLLTHPDPVFFVSKLPIKRITERYYPDGKLKERITEIIEEDEYKVKQT